MGNPLSSLAVDCESAADQPFRAPCIQTYTNKFKDSYHLEPASYSNWDGVVTALDTRAWADGQGGNETLTSFLGPREGMETNTTVRSWPASYWPALTNGSYVTTSSGAPPTSGLALPPLLPWEHMDYDLTRWAPPGVTLHDWHEYVKQDQTVAKMQTGGRSGSGRQSFFWLCGAAQGVLYDDWMPWLDNP